ncbi:MAG: tetratricopeptide repeat protein [Roseofilum sp. Guam]|nr:tetratricopeptide repeat protein [Roseofilum sp. Guam]
MAMLDQIAKAFKRKDYRTAQNLLKNFLQKEPRNPWGRLYAGRLYEEKRKLDLAESIYRQLLQQAEHPKIVAQARSGLQRLQSQKEAQEQQQRQQAIARVSKDPNQAKPGLLIIEPVIGEARKAAAKEFSRIMNLDSYSAQRQLPGRFWRLHRTGNIGELGIYGQELREVGIPAFWVNLEKIEQIRVFRVQSISELGKTVSIMCHDESNQLGTLSFEWSEVAQRVEGKLPIFESVVMLVSGKQERVERTQDYVYLCDLHLPQRNCVLRFCDRSFDFHHSVGIIPPDTPRSQLSTRLQWNSLIQVMIQYLPQTPLWSDFTPFAETVLQEAKVVADPRDLFAEIRPYIDIFRRAETETTWDRAFALYSGLVFCRKAD